MGIIYFPVFCEDERDAESHYREETEGERERVREINAQIVERHAGGWGTNAGDKRRQQMGELEGGREGCRKTNKCKTAVGGFPNRLVL